MDSMRDYMEVFKKYIRFFNLLSVLVLTSITNSEESKVLNSFQVNAEKCMIETTKTVIPKNVKFLVKNSIPSGRVVCSEPGKDGCITKTLLVTKQGEKVISKELLSTNTVKPKEAIYFASPLGYKTSRGMFNRTKCITMRASAYSTSPEENGGYTTSKTGHPLHYGIAAIDPRVIPLNSWLYVEGYGLALACDIGGAIKGDRIDLCHQTVEQANRYGRKVVKVHILSVPPGESSLDYARIKRKNTKHSKQHGLTTSGYNQPKYS